MDFDSLEQQHRDAHAPSEFLAPKGSTLTKDEVDHFSVQAMLSTVQDNGVSCSFSGNVVLTVKSNLNDKVSGVRGSHNVTAQRGFLPTKRMNLL